MKNPVLKLDNISKKIGKHTVLENISLQLYSGEICCILGENGAGKSTLGNLISGVTKQTAGQILIKHKYSDNLTPSRNHGFRVGMSFQETFIFKNLTVMENILLNQEVKYKNSFIFNNDANIKKATEALSIFPEVYINVNTKMSELTLPECKIVELAKIFYLRPQILVLDEPSSSLEQHHVQRLFNLLDMLKEQGTSIVLITHNVEDIYKIADRVIVLSNGHLISDKNIRHLKSKKSLIHDMVGEHYLNHYPKTPCAIGDVILRANKITNIKRTVDNVSFDLHKGEILGIAGLQGSGKSSILKLLFGLEPLASGNIEVNGQNFKKIKPSLAIKNEISYLSDDIYGNIFPYFSSIENIMVMHYHKFIKNGTISWKLLKMFAREAMYYFKIKSYDYSNYITTLSAGNIQKSIICRWALHESKVYLLDEPTKQLDIPSKVDVYNIMNRMAHNSCSLVIVSSDIEELLGMCDRLLVIRGGRLVKDLSTKNATSEDVLTYAFD